MKRLVLIAALAVGLTLPVMAEAAIPQPVYFWGSVVAVIKAPSRPPAIPVLVRPSLILLAEDGSADVEHLQWTSWGSSIAQATGISSASNGLPNMAQGKRIKKPAQVTLSNPGLFQGHEVYRCFTLTVPPPATSDRLCLTDHGGYWILAASPLPGTTASTTTATAPAVAGGPRCTVAAVTAVVARSGLTNFVIEHSTPLKCAGLYAVAIGTNNGVGPYTEVLHWDGTAWVEVSNIGALCDSGDLPASLTPIVCQ